MRGLAHLHRRFQEAIPAKNHTSRGDLNLVSLWHNARLALWRK